MKLLDFFRDKMPQRQPTIRDLSESELIEVKEEIESRASATGIPPSDFYVLLSSDGYEIRHYPAAAGFSVSRGL